MSQSNCADSGCERLYPLRENPATACPKERRLRLLVLGVGNILLTDDGVGVHAVNALRKKPPAGVLVTEVGTALLDAVPLLCWSDRVLVIDALFGQEPPGTLYFASFSEILHKEGSLSLHELDLSAALAFMPRGAPKPEIFVLGVQPRCFEVGLELSSEVAAAIPKIERYVRAKLIEWKRERRPNV